MLIGLVFLRPRVGNFASLLVTFISSSSSSSSSSIIIMSLLLHRIILYYVHCSYYINWAGLSPSPSWELCQPLLVYNYPTGATERGTDRRYVRCNKEKKTNKTKTKTIVTCKTDRRLLKTIGQPIVARLV